MLQLGPSPIYFRGIISAKLVAIILDFPLQLASEKWGEKKYLQKFHFVEHCYFTAKSKYVLHRWVYQNSLILAEKLSTILKNKHLFLGSEALLAGLFEGPGAVRSVSGRQR